MKAIPARIISQEVADKVGKCWGMEETLHLS